MKAIERAAKVLGFGVAVALVASCQAPVPAPTPQPSQAPAATPTRAPQPQPLPQPTAPANWRDAPQTPGTWRWEMAGGRSRALFGVPGAQSVAMLICDKAGGHVLIARAGDGAAAVPLAVTTTTGTRPLISTPSISPSGWIVAQVRVADPVLDAVAFSTGRFVLEAAGTTPLYLPSWPEITRVVEDCR